MCKILVVDDEPDVRSTLTGVLSDAGHIVEAVANEGEALAAVVRETFDFALIDVRLHNGGEEDKSGLSLGMAIRTLKPQVRIIPFTRYVRTEQIVRAIRYHGAVGFVDKNEADWCRRVLETIEEVCQEEARQPKFERAGNITQLSLSLTVGQPLGIRAHGRHVCSLRSQRVLGVALERYARQTELARRDIDNLRFQVGIIGHSIWRDIFVEYPEAYDAYLESRAKSQELSLLFEAPREFLRLPLEFMRSENPPDYLVLQHPLSRFIYNATPKREVLSPSLLALTEKLRILIVASNTDPPIHGVDAEAQELETCLKGQDCIPVEVKLIPTKLATYERVRAELRSRNYDIIHYAGHGMYEPTSPEESSLRFWERENGQGAIMPMRAIELKFLLEQSEARLVYLSCCYGTATGSQVALLNDDFLGLADAAAQAGVPSVLGFRWPVSDRGACKLTQAFYRSLLEQGNPEVALWSARREVAALNRDDPTWLSPILIHQE